MTLYFLQLLNLKKKKCVHFLDFQPRDWDMVISSFSMIAPYSLAPTRWQSGHISVLGCKWRNPKIFCFQSFFRQNHYRFCNWSKASYGLDLLSVSEYSLALTQSNLLNFNFCHTISYYPGFYTFLRVKNSKSNYESMYAQCSSNCKRNEFKN